MIYVCRVQYNYTNNICIPVHDVKVIQRAQIGRIARKTHCFASYTNIIMVTRKYTSAVPQTGVIINKIERIMFVNPQH